MNLDQPYFNPFPGLRPFEPDEDYLFFGRDGQSDEILKRLRTTHFVAVVGVSGCGKSSLVRAGLLPSLHGGFMSKAGSNWRIAIFRPGNNPIGNLAFALHSGDIFGTGTTNYDIKIKITEATMRRGNLGLIEVIKRAKIPLHENLLIVIDQFEEIFRFKQYAKSAEAGDEAAAFVKLLLEATYQKEIPIYVVLTMRSDFLGECAQFRDLPETINDGQYLVPRMTRDQIREAIAGPIAVGGAEITNRLVQRLLNDVGDNPDQLPILQHALMRTWDYWSDNRQNSEPIDLQHYENIGGMDSALSLHADMAYNELTDIQHKKIAEILFKRLTEKGPDNREIRRSAKVQEICEVAQAGEMDVIDVIEKFRRQGRSFVMPPPDIKLSKETWIDISHESLIRNWKRLRDWVDEEAQSAQIYRRLAETAALYSEKKAGRLHDPELQIDLQWYEQNNPNEIWARRYNSEYDRAINFLDESKRSRDAEIKAKELQQRRELKRTRIFAGILAIAFLIALGLAYIAFTQSEKFQRAEKRAQESAEDAKRKEIEARQSEAKAIDAKLKEEAARIEADSLQEIASRQAEIAKRKEIQANKFALAESIAREQADSAKNELEERQQEIERRRCIDKARVLIAEVPFQQQLGNFKLSALLARQAYIFNKENKGDLSNEVHNALRKSLIVPIFKFEDPKIILKHTDWVNSVAFHPNGKIIASGDQYGYLLLTDIDKLDSTNIYLSVHDKWSINSIVFSPDGKILATASDDKTVRLWNVIDQNIDYVDKFDHKSSVKSVVFSPDGLTLFSVCADSTVYLWDILNPNIKPKHLLKHQSRVNAVAINPNGSILAAAVEDNSIRLWDLNELKIDSTNLLRTESPVKSIMFSPNGDILSIGKEDGEVWLWDVSQFDSMPKKLPGHEGSINSVCFSPDGKILASGSSDTNIRLWDLRNIDIPPIVLQDHQLLVNSITFSPDGERLVSGSRDNTIRIWITNTEALADKVCEKVRRNLTKDEWHRFVRKDIPYQPTCNNLSPRDGAQ